jgi:ParB family chromosome partitioning protein
MDDASLAELADSIREQGVMQPILVRPVEGGRFEIIAGERRWRAAQKAGLREVPALVKSVPDQAALALALIENIQREDLNPIEEAQGLKRLVDEFGITHDAAAKAVGRSRSAVTNLLRLTALPKPVQDYVLDGAIDMGHARALLALPAAQQTGVAVRVVNGGLSVRETERLVHGMLNPAKRAARRRASARDADTVRLETEIAEALGAKVTIEPKAGGKGRLVIGYSSLEQLDGIVAKLTPGDSPAR